MAEQKVLMSSNMRKVVLLSAGAFGVAVLANYVANKLESPSKHDKWFAVGGVVLGVGMSIYLMNRFDKDFIENGRTDIKTGLVVGMNV